MEAVDEVGQGLPALSRGKHRGPGRGACLMEYVSVLAGEEFTDRPRCTAPALAELARRVNDGVGEDARARLVLLAPDLISAGRFAVTDDVVVLCCAEGGLAVAPDRRPLLGLRDRARWRFRHRRIGRFTRLPGHGSVGEAYLATASALGSLDPDERDARLVGVLRTALQAVRAERVRDVAPTSRRTPARGATTPAVDR